jgi:preprotein translocase subunit SecG
MDLFVEIVFVLCTLILIAVVLLQAGRGGGLGTALGGGASQGVFGGGGGADFLAKLTQGLAAAFMVCSVYLAYASTHTGSERLRKMSEELESEKHLVGDDEEINYEMVGPAPQPLLPPDAAAPAAARPSVEAEATPEPAVEPEPEAVEREPLDLVPLEEPPPVEGEAAPSDEEAPAPTEQPQVP